MYDGEYLSKAGEGMQIDYVWISVSVGAIMFVYVFADTSGFPICPWNKHTPHEYVQKVRELNALFAE